MAADLVVIKGGIVTSVAVMKASIRRHTSQHGATKFDLIDAATIPNSRDQVPVEIEFSGDSLEHLAAGQGIASGAERLTIEFVVSRQ